MSKQIKAYIAKHPDKFQELHIEDSGNDERGIDYWVYTKAPYFFPTTECGSERTNNVKEMLGLMRTVVKGVLVNNHHWEAE